MRISAYGWDTYPDTETKSFFITASVEDVILLQEKLDNGEPPLWLIDLDGNFHITFGLKVVDWFVSENQGTIYFNKESDIAIKRPENVSPSDSKHIINIMISMIDVLPSFGRSGNKAWSDEFHEECMKSGFDPYECE
jgi:hypothetical protein